MSMNYGSSPPSTCANASNLSTFNGVGIAIVVNVALLTPVWRFKRVFATKFCMNEYPCVAY